MVSAVPGRARRADPATSPSPASAPVGIWGGVKGEPPSPYYVPYYVLTMYRVHALDLVLADGRRQQHDAGEADDDGKAHPHAESDPADVVVGLVAHGHRDRVLALRVVIVRVSQRKQSWVRVSFVIVSLGFDSGQE